MKSEPHLSQVEQKRKYLGGDSEHSILVKGLDMALFEANKAKAAAVSNEDDDMLEETFAGTPLLSPPEPNSVPRKRTREEIVRELKEKRGQAQTTGNNTTVKLAEEEAKLLEEAKKVGKFRPIGFKPIAEEKPKKKKVKGEAKDGERRKKRKVDEGQNSAIAKNVDSDAPLLPGASNPPELLKPQATVTMPIISLEPEPLPEEFNIFADAGEYEGLDLRDEEEEDSAKQIAEVVATVNGSTSAIPRRWIDMDEDDLPIEPPQNEPSTSRLLPRKSGPPSPGRHTTLYPLEEGEMEEEKQMHLRPLESSALPSIKDFLAMQEAADTQEKRKKRKEKKKAKVNK